jgi:NADH dehydrogenase
MPSAVQDGIQRVDHDGTLALIEASEHYGVKRFIYVSQSENFRVESPLERAKRDCENRLIRSRMEAVILRPSCFMEDWLSPMLGFDPANGYARIYGSGEEKVSYISAANVADFAVAVASGSVEEKNTILEVGGPDALSQLEVVRIFEECLGKVVKIERIPAETLWKRHESADPRERTFAALMLAVAKGDEVPYAVKTARHYRVHLRSVTEYASQVASGLAVSASS